MNLTLLDIGFMKSKLDALKMELQDSALPLLRTITVTTSE